MEMDFEKEECEETEMDFEEGDGDIYDPRLGAHGKQDVAARKVLATPSPRALSSTSPSDTTSVINKFIGYQNP
jgi:hypothetical protein